MVLLVTSSNMKRLAMQSCVLTLIVSSSLAFAPLMNPVGVRLLPSVVVRTDEAAIYLPSRVFLSSSDSSSESTSTAAAAIDVTSLPVSNPRTVARMEKFARLPVWPVWNGVAIFILSKIFGDEVGAKLEDAIGGRVCPNFFSTDPRVTTTSPFIMLVHHRHSFAAWDVLRYIQRTFFPEGFPAHPHRGFVTVTYILKGGFRHRDSLGVKQLYGADTSNTGKSRYGGKHTQWLTTGGGMLHEEMFDMGEGNNFFQPADQELYQLWLNLPSQDKLMSPRIDLLGGPEDTPTVVTSDNGKSTETIVIAGTHGEATSTAPIRSDLAILHVKMEAGTEWRHEMPASHETVVLYVRRGAIEIEGERIPPHHTAYLSSQGASLTVINAEDGGEADFLLLAGQPLREPVAAQGSMVMNTADQINDAYDDYQRGLMGLPWSEQLSDVDWMTHVEKYPSRYSLKDGR
jgi:redox-sensitive bicupin YhaK (pirin superfamily)